MVEKLYTIFSELETFIDSGLRILGSFSIVNSSELYKKFRMIYDLLPDEVKQNKDNLKREKEDNVIAQLDKLNLLLGQSLSIGSFIIINTTDILKILDSIYTKLPEDVKFCREKFLKN